MDFARSIQFRNRALILVPDGAMTASKSPRRFVQGVSPVYAESGHGAHLVDVDGNEYIDTSMALGTVVLGYSHGDVDKAVHAQVERGPLFTLPGALEVEVAEELVNHWVFWADMVRFVKTGSEATSAAIRLARAVTGRENVASIRGHYHGWADWTLGRTPPAVGVPHRDRESEFRQCAYGDVKQLERLLGQLPDRPAALIMEPIGLEEWPVDDTFIKAARELCIRYSVIFILDEVLTGIRFNPTGAAKLGVVPDLMTLGKAMGNGYPVAALVGKEEYMRRLNQDDVFVSGTYAGELVSLAAARATLETLGGSRSPHVLYGLWEWGERLLTKTREILERGLGEGKGLVRVRGNPVHHVVEWANGAERDLFQQECVRRGVLYTGNHNISLAHRNDDIFVRWMATYQQAAHIVREARDRGEVEKWVEGEASRQGFRRQG